MARGAPPPQPATTPDPWEAWRLARAPSRRRPIDCPFCPSGLDARGGRPKLESLYVAPVGGDKFNGFGCQWCGARWHRVGLRVARGPGGVLSPDGQGAPVPVRRPGS